MSRRSGFAALFIVFSLGSGIGAGPAVAACAPKAFDGASFTVCAFDPRRDDLRLFWKGADGKPYGSLAALADALKSKGERLAFAMNAGMFAEDQSPVGLYVENRVKLHDADTRGGATNFHMKPNGCSGLATARRASPKQTAISPIRRRRDLPRSRDRC